MTTSMAKSMANVTLVQLNQRHYRIPTASLSYQQEAREAQEETNAEPSTLYTEAIIIHRHPVNRNYHGMIVGKKGSTIKRLKIETGARIDITKGKDTIMIKGTQDNVDKAIQAIDAMVEEAYHQAKPTHFLSLSVASPLTARKLEEFHSSIVSTAQNRGIDPSLLVSSANLHITLGVFKLMSQSDIEQAVKYLKDEIPAVVARVLQGDHLSVHLQGLRTMQPDPSKAQVVYIEVKDNSKHQTLEAMCMAIREAMQPFTINDKKPFKIHTTLINTRYQKTQGSLEASDALETPDALEVSDALQNRGTLDVRSLLQRHGALDLGSVVLNKLHLMRMGRTGPGDTYESIGSIMLC
ncbi:AKAP7 2'5' RNA ligase-like domain-containing protein [Spinellus fusiger]|nr:AKAP7 2'5' RNA ligase-like domain-containing protein [Spinellus fusiger]